MSVCVSVCYMLYHVCIVSMSVCQYLSMHILHVVCMSVTNAHLRHSLPQFSDRHASNY